MRNPKRLLIRSYFSKERRQASRVLLVPQAFEYFLKADLFFKESLIQRAQHSQFGMPDTTLLEHEGRSAALAGKGTLATRGELDKPSSNTKYKHAGTSHQSVIWRAEMTISLDLSTRPGPANGPFQTLPRSLRPGPPK